MRARKLYGSLNGVPDFYFNELLCEPQQEPDCYWQKLFGGGDEHAQWLKDKFGCLGKSCLQYYRLIADPVRSESVMTPLLKI